MYFSSTLRNLTVSLGAVGAGLLLSAPALAELTSETLLADHHQSNEEMMTDPAAQTPNSMSIVDVASGSESFNTLVQALQAANLTNTLSGEGPYTVFAPTDEAFNQLPAGALDYLLQPENQDLLVEVLSYHVVPGAITSDEITSGGVDTLNGGIAVNVTDAGVVVNNASVVNPDIQASNGVIHAVNRVLIPADLQQQLATQLGVDSLY